MLNSFASFYIETDKKSIDGMHKKNASKPADGEKSDKLNISELIIQALVAFYGIRD